MKDPLSQPAWQAPDGQSIAIRDMSDEFLAALVETLLEEARETARTDWDVLVHFTQHPLWRDLVAEVYARGIEWRVSLPDHSVLLRRW